MLDTLIKTEGGGGEEGEHVAPNNRSQKLAEIAAGIMLILFSRLFVPQTCECVVTSPGYKQLQFIPFAYVPGNFFFFPLSLRAVCLTKQRGEQEKRTVGKPRKEEKRKARKKEITRFKRGTCVVPRAAKGSVC